MAEITGSISHKKNIQGVLTPRKTITATINNSSLQLIGKLSNTTLQGYSAYEVAVQNGYTGTEEEWLATLIGNGISSAVLNSDYTLTLNFTNGASYTTGSIRGENGIADYEYAINKPQIESVELAGNRTLAEMGLESISADDLLEILN